MECEVENHFWRVRYRSARDVRSACSHIGISSVNIPFGGGLLAPVRARRSFNCPAVDIGRCGATATIDLFNQ
jgi:hypothetical protein